MKSILFLPIIILFIAGCATPGPYSEFVRTINFSPLDTFEYRHTLISGMDFRAAEEHIIKTRSESVLVDALRERGFTAVEENADFFVVTKWKKGVSIAPSRYAPINEPDTDFNRRLQNDLMYGVIVEMTVEIYESASGELFWRKKLPHVCDALQFSESRVEAALLQAIQNFPQRIEKDPNLPSLN